MIALSHPFCVCFFVTNVYDKHIFMSCQNLLTHTSGGFQCQNDFIKVDFSQNDNLEFFYFGEQCEAGILVDAKGRFPGKSERSKFF